MRGERGEEGAEGGEGVGFPGLRGGWGVGHFVVLVCVVDVECWLFWDLRGVVGEDIVVMVRLVEKMVRLVWMFETASAKKQSD